MYNYITDDVIDALNYIEKELFNKNSSFFHYLQFMERKEPIIEIDNMKENKIYHL